MSIVEPDTRVKPRNFQEAYIEYRYRLEEETAKILINDGISALASLGIIECSGNLYKHILVKIEKPLLEAVLEHTNGNKMKAARVLGIIGIGDMKINYDNIQKLRELYTITKVDWELRASYSLTEPAAPYAGIYHDGANRPTLMIYGDSIEDAINSVVEKCVNNLHKFHSKSLESDPRKGD